MTAAPVSDVAAGAALLREPAYRAVRVVANARIVQIEEAFARFEAGDEEGLHDVRVAMRRLRTWLRAYRVWVGDSLRKKTSRRLRRLARATGGARDAEVAAEWVTSHMDVAPRLRRGVQNAADALHNERDDALKTLRERLRDELPKLVALLHADLTPARLDPHASSPAETLAAAATPVIDKQRHRLLTALQRARKITDADAAHCARIDAKRLRYILEPMYEPAVMRESLAPLVDLQDVLGTARDAHQLSQKYVHIVGELAARVARDRTLTIIGAKRRGKRDVAYLLKPGYVELARLAHLEERRSFREFRERWGKKERAAPMLASVCSQFAVPGAAEIPSPAPPSESVAIPDNEPALALVHTDSLTPV